MSLSFYIQIYSRIDEVFIYCSGENLVISNNEIISGYERRGSSILNSNIKQKQMQLFRSSILISGF